MTVELLIFRTELVEVVNKNSKNAVNFFVAYFVLFNYYYNYCNYHCMYDWEEWMIDNNVILLFKWCVHVCDGEILLLFKQNYIKLCLILYSNLQPLYDGDFMIIFYHKWSWF